MISLLKKDQNVGRAAGSVALYRDGRLEAVSDEATAGRELIGMMTAAISDVHQDEQHEWRQRAPTTALIEWGADGDIHGTQLIVDGVVRMALRVVPERGLTDDEIAQYVKACSRRTMLKDEHGSVLSFDQLCSATANNLMYMLEGEIEEMHFWWDNAAQTLKTRMKGFGERQDGIMTLADEGDIDV